jgi:hypothetical protein
MAENFWGKDAVKVRFTDCEHTMWIPLGHSAGHARPCYACDPELAKEPIPGECPVCEDARRRAVQEQREHVRGRSSSN